MKFNNRPNESFKIDGQLIWNSRSTSSIMTVNCQIGGIEYILMVKRGRGVIEEVGKWCLPCGFLDWDESGLEAAIRETWEETGINVREDFKGNLLYDLNEQPWRVVSEPQVDKYQSISLHFGFSAKVTKLPEIRGPQGGPADETEQVKWIQYEDICNMNVAFNHEERVRQFLIHRNWARHHATGE